MKYLSTMAALALLFIGTGCAEELEEIEVFGEVTVTGDEIDTGFRFDQATNLVDDRQENDASIAGHCEVGEGGQFEVVILRPGPGTDDRSIRAFQVVSDEEGVKVVVELGAVGYEGVDGDSCVVDVTTADPAAGRVLFDLDCAVTSEGGEVVDAAGSLSFASCEPLP